MQAQQPSGSQIGRDGVPNAFTVIKGIDRSFEMRGKGAKNAQKLFPSDFDAYNFRKDPFGRYSGEGLCDLREEAKKELNEFWRNRQRVLDGCRYLPRKDVPRLFDEQYRWSDDCTSVEAKSAERNRPEPLKLDEQTVKLFLLLTTPKNELNSDIFEIRHLVGEVFRPIIYNVDGYVENLAGILHPEALERLVSCLAPKQFLEFFDKINSYRDESGLSEKLASAFCAAHGTRELGLSWGFALTQIFDGFSGGLIRRLQESGEKGRELAGKLAKALDTLAEAVKRTTEDAKAVLEKEAGAQAQDASGQS